MLTLDKVYHANYVLKDVARETDIIYSPTCAINFLASKFEPTIITNSTVAIALAYPISKRVVP